MSLQIPNDMVLVNKDDIEALLEAAIARGEKLGCSEADDDYRQWLRELRDSRPTTIAQDVANPWGLDDTEMQEGEWVGDEGAR